jgi:hypothetical protein
MGHREDPGATGPAPAAGRQECALALDRSRADQGVAARVVSTLERAKPFLGRLARSALRLAGLAVVAGAAVWWGIARAVPSGEARLPLLTLAAVLLLAPPAMLVLFVLAVRALVALPDRLRAVPGAVRERLTEIGSHAGAVTAIDRGSVWTRLRSLFRVPWSIASSREVIEVLGPWAALISPWMLPAAIVASVASLIEILLGAFVLVWLTVA